MATSACVPSLSDETVTWLTRGGHRNATLSEEATDLEPDGIADRFVSDLVDIGELNKDTPAAEAYDLIYIVLSDHYHRSLDDTFTSRLDTYLSSIADRELGIEEGLRETLRLSLNQGLNDQGECSGPTLSTTTDKSWSYHQRSRDTNYTCEGRKKSCSKTWP
jgi:hypothetical protein